MAADSSIQVLTTRWSHRPPMLREISLSSSARSTGGTPCFWASLLSMVPYQWRVSMTAEFCSMMRKFRPFWAA